MCALQVHLARISRKGSDPLTRVKFPHSLPWGHCIPDDRKFIEFFRALCLSRLTRVSAILPQTARFLNEAHLARGLQKWAGGKGIDRKPSSDRL